MLSLSNLWPPITNLSQKQKQCSLVALYSFKVVGLFRGEDATGRRWKEQGLFQSLQQECHEVLWQIMSELPNSTLQRKPASKFASLMLTTREAAPNGSHWKDS